MGDKTVVFICPFKMMKDRKWFLFPLLFCRLERSYRFIPLLHGSSEVRCARILNTWWLLKTPEANLRCGSDGTKVLFERCTLQALKPSRLGNSSVNCCLHMHPEWLL